MIYAQIFTVSQHPLFFSGRLPRQRGRALFLAFDEIAPEENKSCQVSELCDGPMILKVLQVNTRRKWNLFNDPLEFESVTHVRWADLIKDIRSHLKARFPKLSLVTVENDTSTTRHQTVVDGLGCPRILKATMADYLVVARPYIDKLSEAGEYCDVVDGIMLFIEQQSGKKGILQSLAQVFLTMHIQIISRQLSLPRSVVSHQSGYRLSIMYVVLIAGLGWSWRNT